MPLKIIAAAVPLLFAAAAHAQTQAATTNENAPADANSGVQAQQDPVGPTHADGKAGKSSRPWFSQESEPDLHAVPR
ncbi:MAG: hypothetical protein WDN29_03435 [Methylovirgula sp.]